MQHIRSYEDTAMVCVQTEGLASTPVAVVATDTAALRMDLAQLEAQVETILVYREHDGRVEYLSLTMFGAEVELKSLLIGPLGASVIEAFVDAQKVSEEWVLLVRDTSHALSLVVDTMTGSVRVLERLSVNSVAQWYPIQRPGGALLN